MKGTALSNAEQIRTVHNSFAGYHGFELDESKKKRSDESYHFVSFVPVDGVLYELDGLKEGPIDHGKISEGKTWLDYALPIIELRMAACADGNFNLMAVVPTRLQLYLQQLSQALASPQTPSSELISELERNIEFERKKNIAYREENLRRRHNYLPLIIELLKILGEQGTLVDLVKKANDQAQNKTPACLGPKR